MTTGDPLRRPRPEAGDDAPESARGVSIVIPALDEIDAIVDTVERCKAVGKSLEGTAFEVLVVDDGSSDGTGALAREHGARVVRHPKAAGYGRALKDGILQARYDTIVISDADGTYPVEEIPRLLELYGRGFDMVVGARSGEHYRQSLFKMPMRTLLRWLVEFTAGCRIPDINSGLRVFSRTTVLPYFPRLCDTFSFTTSLTLAYLMTARYIEHVPIAYHERLGRTKVRLFRDSLRTLQYIVQSILYYNPIKIFLVLAGLCVAAGGVGFLTSVLLGINLGYYFGLGSAVMAVVVFSLGLLAEQLRQIMIK